LIGCKDFDDEEVIVNIILESLNSNIKASYSATNAELKAVLHRDPDSIIMITLDKIFSTINDSLVCQKNDNKERANFVQQSSSNSKKYFSCGKDGQIKCDCLERGNGGKRYHQENDCKKQDLSQITCHFSPQKGHYAN
jgi:hypothetical protein